jgi:hypothetical protein
LKSSCSSSPSCPTRPSKRPATGIASCLDSEDVSELVYDDAERIAQMLGITFDRKDGDRPAIYWSGFSSQGDGACFEGRYGYAKGAPAAIKAYAPEDATLLQIAKALQHVQRINGYRLTATIKHSGHYYHANCTDIDVYKGEAEVHPSTEQQVKAALRNFMDWIYRQLELESEGLNADETVADNIRVNGYEFEADGSFAERD